MFCKERWRLFSYLCPLFLYNMVKASLSCLHQVVLSSREKLFDVFEDSHNLRIACDRGGGGFAHQLDMSDVGRFDAEQSATDEIVDHVLQKRRLCCCFRRGIVFFGVIFIQRSWCRRNQIADEQLDP